MKNKNKRIHYIVSKREKENEMLKAILQREFYPTLREGEYITKLKSFSLKEDKTMPSKSYVRFDFEVLEGDEKGRAIVENKFQKGLPIMVSHLRQQLGREHEKVVPEELFNELIKEGTPITIYVTKVNHGRQYTNINFLPALPEAELEVAEDDDTVSNILEA